MKKCDIIIPIYNAYDCLSDCIESVIKFTDLNNNRVILINDNSSDNRVLPLLKKYSSNNIILINNDVNQGFVKNVNIGIKYSNDNDVLLLNSDTIVTSNWLKKIQKCAYSDEYIATVTPLSNNATFASVPKSFYKNELPDNYNLEEFSKIVENCSFNSYPEIPTGHGFCLFIKRSAIKTVGFFDAETYGKGYGEENDFCFRCLDCGLKNVLCDNTYIFHKESQSFSKEKEELINQGLTALKLKYPKYKDRLDLWCSKKSLDYIGNNICLFMSQANNTVPNILYIIHDWKNVPNNVGSTTTGSLFFITGQNAGGVNNDGGPIVIRAAVCPRIVNI
jgi:GT2 family glycosyltransferase